MRKVFAIFIMLVMACQSFSHWMIVGVFRLNQAWIAKNSCENRFRPKLHCNGNCVLMKKLRQKEKEDQKEPAQLKLEVSSVVISCRSFFSEATINFIPSVVRHNRPFNTGTPVDRSFSFFQPPRSV